MTQRPLAPWLVTPLKPCSIVLERHTHKNGGSTLRHIVNTNDMLDGWGFWGYGLHQHWQVTDTLTGALLGPRNASCSDWDRRAPFRLFAEHHYSRMGMRTILAAFGPTSPLQQVALNCQCTVVLVTRLREPTSYYVSFYRWTVSWRQARNSTLFGATILDWAPRNLQSSIMLRPIDATWAEFLGVNTKDGQAKRREYSQFDDAPGPDGRLPPGATVARRPGEGAKQRALLRSLLSSFDLVGLMERFDETLLLLADLTGLQRLLHMRAVPGTTNPHYAQPSVSAVCPDPAACDARVREVAPFDHELYGAFSAAFAAKVSALGAPFQARLRAFRQANAAYQSQTLRARAERIAAAKRSGAEDDFDGEELPRVIARHRSSPTQMHGRVPMNRLHCPVGGGSSIALEACQRIFADTPFRFNWRHTRASCCQHIHACLAIRLARRRLPTHCYHWLPEVGDPRNERAVRGPGYVAMAKAINESLPTICDTECTLPPDVEPPFATAPYRVPSAAESAVRASTFAKRVRDRSGLLEL